MLMADFKNLDVLRILFIVLFNPDDSVVLGQGAEAMDEGVGGKVPEEVPAKLFSERSGTITHVPLCGHNLLLKTSHVLFK